MSAGESVLKVGVTDLVRFAARQGNLFNDEALGPDAEQGQLGHKQVQRSRKPPWQSEVALSSEWQIAAEVVVLSGRLDLLNADAAPVIIEEIKTCLGPGHVIPDERKTLHWAQARVYAALFARQSGKEETLKLRLTYYDLDSRQLFPQEETLSASDAISYCESLLATYVAWWQRVTAQREAARRHCQQIAFPFAEFRPGQRSAAVQVYRALRDGHPALIEAPTGTGKTLSTLFPALKAFAERSHQQTLYLTAKGSTQLHAQATLEQLDPQRQLDVLHLQARDKACPCLSDNNEQRQTCHHESGLCSRSLGFYDRLPEARIHALQIRHLTPEALQALAADHQLCPFALAIHLVPWFSVVIADINYVFDPLVRLACFDQHTQQRVLLIDEAHNLPARAREMYSAELDSGVTDDIRRHLPRSNRVLNAALNQLVQALRRLDEQQLADHKAALHYPLQAVLNALHQFGDNGFAGGLLAGLPDGYRPWVKALYRFVAILNLYGNNHIFQLAKYDGEQRLHIRCLDASDQLSALHSKARSTVAFSATLQPFPFALQQLGLPAASPCLSLPKAFPPENLLTLCCSYITTQWHQRQSSTPALVALIARFYHSREGHYLVFFPSYDYLATVLEAFTSAHPEIEVLSQQQYDTDQERAAFIQRFMTEEKALLGFAIVGGVYAEGIDFAGEALVGAMVIGTGMPQPSEEQQKISQRFNERGLNGFQYAFQFPGLIRLLQTAGRVIRSSSDRGVVLFVEPRLLRPDYRDLLQPQVTLVASHSLEHTQGQLQAFWRQKSTEQ